MYSRSARSLDTRWWLGLALVLACACLGVLPGLGDGGFRATEGHRVIPGWELLESGDLVPTRMFETAYVRKPPGTPWSIAASGALLGESEFSARLPSALAGVGMAVLVFFVSTRWFGLMGGTTAGAVQGLFPLFWLSTRTAEIEGLHSLGVMLACLGAGALALERARPARLCWCVAVVGGCVIMGLAKGPAAVPAVVGACIAAAVIARGRGAARWVLGGALLGAVIGVGVLGGVMAWSSSAIGDERAVRQGLGEFVWNLDKLGGVALFPVLLFAGGLPASLALLFPWGGDARAEAATGGEDSGLAFDAARALALGWVFGVVCYMLLGVDNNRYGLPSQVMLAPLLGYVAWGVYGRRSSGGGGGFDATRARIGRWVLLGHPAVLVAVLIGVSQWWVWSGGRAQSEDSGRDAGVALAEFLPADSVVWADGCVEARPETLWYAARAAADDDRPVRVVWKKWAITEGEAAPPGTVLVLRADDRPDRASELVRYTEASGVRTRELGRVDVHKYTYAALLVLD